MKEYERLMRKMPAHVLRAYETFQVTKSISKTAEIIGVHRNTVGQWRKKYQVERAKEAVESGKIDIEDINDLIKVLKYQRELAGDKVDESVDVNVMFAIAELHQTISERRAKLLYNDDEK